MTGSKILLTSSLEGRVDKIKELVSEVKPKDVVVVEDARIGAMAINEDFGPTTRRRQKAYIRRLYKGAKVHFVSIGQDSYEVLKERFSNADFVHIEGGQTMMLTHALNRRPDVFRLLHSTIRKKGGVGQSAGAIVMGSFNTSFVKGDLGDLPFWETYVREQGIRDTPRDRKKVLKKSKCGILTHADDRNEYIPRVKKYLVTRTGSNECIFALNNSAYVIINSRTGKVLEHCGLRFFKGKKSKVTEDSISSRTRYKKNKFDLL